MTPQRNSPLPHSPSRALFPFLKHFAQVSFSRSPSWVYNIPPYAPSCVPSSLLPLSSTPTPPGRTWSALGSEEKGENGIFVSLRCLHRDSPVTFPGVLASHPKLLHPAICLLSTLVPKILHPFPYRKLMSSSGTIRGTRPGANPFSLVPV
jgi:hypothetical protein